MYYIYVLLCPDTGKVRYIGKTMRLKGRKQAHRNGYGISPVDRWKRVLTANGKTAIFRIIEEVEDRGVGKWREHWWIRYFRHQGQPILNISTISAKTARAIRNPNDG